MENQYTRALAEYIAASRFEHLPPQIVEHAKLLALDTLGVGIFGTTLPWSERLRATAQATEAPGKVSVWSTPLRFSAPTAAMINATAVHAFELDDVGPGGHNGSVTLSAALAVAEQGGKLSGQELLNAIVVGIETAARVSNSVGRRPHEDLGFHGPGLFGTFAAMGSAAAALHLSADDNVHALGHAGQQAASLMFTHHGGMGKRLLAGQAARAGTFAALLAQNGFTNADNVFEAEYGGFCSAHTGNRKPAAYDLTQLTKELGKRYHTGHVRFKMWASRMPNHSTLEAIKALRKEHAIAADRIRQVRIKLGRGYMQNVGWAYTPTTITSAQLNLHYVCAIMLLENDVLIDQFSEEKIRDPKVLGLIERIAVTHEPSMDGTGYVEGNPVEIEMTDGTVHAAWGKARGGLEHPIPHEDVIEKFRKLTTRVIAKPAQDALIAQCMNLEQLADARQLLAPIAR